MVMLHTIRSTITNLVIISLMVLGAACNLWRDPPPVINRNLETTQAITENNRVFSRSILVRSDHSYPPFEFINTDGEPDGFNIELLRSIARIMHLEIHIDLGPWEEVRGQLERGEIDMLAGMFKTPQRAELVDFTIPHFTSAYSLFAPKNSNIHSLADVRGKRLAVQIGDLGYDYIKSIDSGAILVEFIEWHDTFSAISKGQADVAISGMLQGISYIYNNKLKNIEAVGEPLMQEMYCMAVRKGDAALLATLNEGLSILKASGEYDAIFDKWFAQLSITANRDRLLIRRLLLVLFIAIGLIALVLVWTNLLRLQVRRKTVELSTQLAEGNQIRHELQQALAEAERLRHVADEANRSKSVFLAHISHELRTPLHGMLAMSNLLADSGLNEDQQELITNQQAAALQLERLLTDLLDLTRGAAGKLSLSPATFRLGELGLWTREALQQSASLKGLAFYFRIHQPDALLLADLSRLNQILINLATNAIKYTKRGSVEISIRLEHNAPEATPANTAQLFIEVNDTGPGISQADQARIFQAFVQGEKTTSGSVMEAGVGLGLAIVKMLVDLMNGSIVIQDKAEPGTNFLVRLPVSLQDQSAVAEATTTPPPAPMQSVVLAPPEAKTSSPAKNLHILVAEDEALNILYLRRLLGRDGHTISGVGTGTEAVKACQQQDFDLVLMDIGLPELNGMEATKAIRQWEQANGRTAVPIAALTAHAYQQDKEDCLAAGMNGFLTKPFTIRALLVEIDRLTRN